MAGRPGKTTFARQVGARLELPVLNKDVVNAPPHVIVERFRARSATGERHPAHPDEQLLPEIERNVQQPYEPPPLRGAHVDVELTESSDAAVSAALDEVAQAYEVAFPDSP